MIVRLVRMTFHPSSVDDFLTQFAVVKDEIRSFPGCLHLELLQNDRFPNILSTYSVWDSRDALESYRNSEMFIDIWQRTSAWFVAPPRASSWSQIQTAKESASLASLRLLRADTVGASSL